jgi:hypothetical protein
MAGSRVELKLEVVAGAHRGAVLRLDEGDYRIGNSLDADIVLSDRGVVPEHAVLHVGHDELRLSATGADVKIDRKILPVSHGCRLRLPVSLTLGTAQIDLSDTAEDSRGHAVFRRPLGVVGILSGVCLAVFVGLAVVVARGSSPAAGPTVVAVASNGNDQSPVGSMTAHAGSSSMEDAVRALNARLEAAKIQSLRISAENGRLSATGTLAGRSAADWAAIQQWFDQTYGGRFVLTTRFDQSGEPRAMPALRLQAIWYGERPYIVAADGEHYFNGAVLNDGWVVRDIGENRVLLAKDDQTVALNYR